MPTVRTTCPTCQTVVVEASEMTLRRRLTVTQAECTFMCPDCLRPVVQRLSDRMVPVLIGAGCQIEDWDEADLHASPPVEPLDGRITETEIALFIVALEDDDWYSELLDER